MEGNVKAFIHWCEVLLPLRKITDEKFVDHLEGQDKNGDAFRYWQERAMMSEKAGGPG